MLFPPAGIFPKGGKSETWNSHSNKTVREGKVQKEYSLNPQQMND